MAKIGIDLGTSNTLVAKIDANGDPDIIEINGNDDVIPSVICIEEEGGHKAFGLQALRHWEDGQEIDKMYFFKRWKLRIGEDHIITEIRFGGQRSNPVQITPEWLTTQLVQYIVKTISEGEDGETIDEVLITVPHGWRREKPEKCRATRIAAAEATVGDKKVRVQDITVSEPIAAAAYWLYMMRKNNKSETYEGKTLLVCDIGGGTFDLSLVVIGSVGKPLDVVAADNNNYAGDYVDALICAEVCRRFNMEHGTKYPEDAEEILNISQTNEMPWIRRWLFTCRQEIKEKFSASIEEALKRGRAIESLNPRRNSFYDNENRNSLIEFTSSEFIKVIEPFYNYGIQLLEHFLSRLPEEKLPYAVLTVGGGSLVYGVKDLIIKRVLSKIFKNQDKVDEFMSRTALNNSKLDKAIVLGAALIANKIIEVQERLLHDIGIAIDIEEEIATALGLAKTTKEIFVTPILKKGSILPAKASTKDFIPLHIVPGDKIVIKVIIDDDSADPWVQTQEISMPTGQNSVSIEVSLEADPDGALFFEVIPLKSQHSIISVDFRHERLKKGRASIALGWAEDRSTKIDRVSPEKLREIYNRSNWGGQQ